MRTASRAIPSRTLSGPTATLATCSGPGSEVSTTSVRRATSEGEVARAAPSASKSAKADSRTS